MTPDQIEKLLCADAYSHPVEQIELLETHISWIILTGTYAYKIKKPVDFGFLDFTELERREYYCHEELRLNRRTAEAIYIDVVPISRTGTGFFVGGSGKPVDYAVKMLQFDNRQLLATLVSEQKETEKAGQNSLKPAMWREFATATADFHRDAEISREQDYGTPALIHAAVEQNFNQIRPYLMLADDIHWLAHIESWSEESGRYLEAMMIRRKQEGFVRDCHGDLHLGNMVLIDDKIVPFDCVEFSRDFRVIDTVSDIAFTLMDMELRGLQPQANLFLNSYLESSGDYQGLALLTYYKVYRAMVRAKVSLLATPIQSRKQLAGSQAYTVFQQYLQLALHYLQEKPVFLAIMHGVSGSGKSYLARQLAEAFEAVHVRSDVERKRLFGLLPGESSGSSIDGGIYSKDASERTFLQLAELAEIAIDSGHPCFIDATFLSKARRLQFRTIAEKCGVPFIIIDCQPPEHVIVERLKKRKLQGNDPSEADEKIMYKQTVSAEPLTADEKMFTVCTDTIAPFNMDLIRHKLLPMDF